MKLIPILCVSLCPLWLNAALPPSIWPQWRGDGSGIASSETGPVAWSTTKNIAWKTKIEGYGWSCPVVANGKIFLTTAIHAEQEPPLTKGPGSGYDAPDYSIRREVHCYDLATGKLAWRQIAADLKPTHGNHPSNTWATETPVTDGQRVFAFFGNVGLYCYDFTGKLLWKRELDSHRTFANWGTSASPVLEGERIFILSDTEDEPFLTALDTKTGKEDWTIQRTERSTWASPLIWRNTKRTELVIMGSSYIRGYDPNNGRELWRLASERFTTAPGSAANSGPPPKSDGKGKGESKGKGDGGKSASGGCKSTPTCTPDMLYVACAPKSRDFQLGPMWAVKPGASGDISLREGSTSNKDIAFYRYGAGPHFSSPVVKDGLIYVYPPHRDGVLSCFDGSTGELVYEGNLPGNNGFKTSAWTIGEHIYGTDERGITYVVKAGRKFELIAENDLAEMTWTSPAIVNGQILLRTTTTLYCIGQ